MFEFSWPWLFILLPLPWLLRLLKPVPSEGSTRLRIPGFAKHNLASQVAQQHTRSITVFEWLVWALLVCAIANPTWLMNLSHCLTKAVTSCSQWIYRVQ